MHLSPCCHQVRCFFHQQHRKAHWSHRLRGHYGAPAGQLASARLLCRDYTPPGSWETDGNNPPLCRWAAAPWVFGKRWLWWVCGGWGPGRSGPGSLYIAGPSPETGAGPAGSWGWGNGSGQPGVRPGRTVVCYLGRSAPRPHMPGRLQTHSAHWAHRGWWGWPAGSETSWRTPPGSPPRNMSRDKNFKKFLSNKCWPEKRNPK